MKRRRETSTSIICCENKELIVGALRGAGRTVATGCGKTASEASGWDRHGTCFDDGVPFVDSP
jgi:hypothetical protein